MNYILKNSQNSMKKMDFNGIIVKKKKNCQNDIEVINITYMLCQVK